MSEFLKYFGQPWYLALLLLLPGLWMLSYRGLSGLGFWRRIAALALRTAVVAAIILALAEFRIPQDRDRLAVIFLLDQSLSIPEAKRAEMAEYVNLTIETHRKGDDLAGVIVFGREAAVEVPPFDYDIQVPRQIESLLDPRYTNLEDAMKLALASFPEGVAKRIVVVSDGDQNIGDALSIARDLADKGVSIDVRPIKFGSSGDVIVEKLTRPANVRQGQPFDLSVVLNNTHDRPVTGRLIFYQKTEDDWKPINQAADPDAGGPDLQRITLQPGKSVRYIRQVLDQTNFYEYQVRFIPDDVADDAVPQNNVATAFAHVRGRGQILLIENQEQPGQHTALVERLRRNKIDVTVRPSGRSFGSLPELQQYDAVILADVPREQFTDNQIKMLVTNTQHMGAGLVMIGGPNSFGAGGWTNSELEQAMPLDFQIKNAKVVPKGALALIMHASELPQGNHWQKVIAREAIQSLGDLDYCALLHWNGNEQFLWTDDQGRGFVSVQGNRARMLARLDRMSPGDMPDFDPTMKKGLQGFNALTDAAVKHMVIISDGDPTPPSAGVVNAFVQAGVTVSTVAVGTHGPAGSRVMQQLANATGGKYYAVTNNRALPRIFQQEARRVSRPLVYETPPPFTPSIHTSHEIIDTLQDFPPLSGYVMTTPKVNPLVDVILTAPRPAGQDNAILAAWTYGLGRTVCLTTDAGERWANQWTAWPGYEKFFTQLVRWVARPAADEGQFTVAMEVENEKIRVVVTALDENDEFLNLLNITGTAVGPAVDATPFSLEQVAPGRYVGELPADEPGSYFLMLNPGLGLAPIRAGVNVPYSSEFRQRVTNEGLLKTLAELTPGRGRDGSSPGPTGQFIDVTGVSTPEEYKRQLLSFDPFRHDLYSEPATWDAWFYLVLLGSCVFLADVFIRRVHVSFAWVAPLVLRVLGREPEEAVPTTLERLRTRKREVSEEIEQRKAAARFEPSPDAPLPEGTDLAAMPPVAPRPPSQPGGGLAPGQEQEDETYTSRLLKAKRKLWDQQNKPKDES